MKVAVKNISNNITQDEMDAGRLQSVFDITVEEGSKVTLPESFSQSVREDLVRDAVASSRANRRQAYGSRQSFFVLLYNYWRNTVVIKL